MSDNKSKKYRVELGFDRHGMEVPSRRNWIYLPCDLVDLTNRKIASHCQFRVRDTVTFRVFDISKELNDQEALLVSETETKSLKELAVSFSAARDQIVQTPIANDRRTITLDSFIPRGLKHSPTFRSKLPAWDVQSSGGTDAIKLHAAGNFLVSYHLTRTVSIPRENPLDPNEPVKTKIYHHDPEWVVGGGDGGPIAGSPSGTEAQSDPSEGS